MGGCNPITDFSRSFHATTWTPVGGCKLQRQRGRRRWRRRRSRRRKRRRRERATKVQHMRFHADESLRRGDGVNKPAALDPHGESSARRRHQRVSCPALPNSFRLGSFRISVRRIAKRCVPVISVDSCCSITFHPVAAVVNLYPISFPLLLLLPLPLLLLVSNIFFCLPFGRLEETKQERKKERRKERKKER